MKWTKKEKPTKPFPEHGTKQIFSFFAFLPFSIGNDTFWLERVNVVCTFKWFYAVKCNPKQKSTKGAFSDILLNEVYGPEEGSNYLYKQIEKNFNEDKFKTIGKWEIESLFDPSNTEHTKLIPSTKRVFHFSRKKQYVRQKKK